MLRPHAARCCQYRPVTHELHAARNGNQRHPATSTTTQPPALSQGHSDFGQPLWTLNGSGPRNAPTRLSSNWPQPRLRGCRRRPHDRRPHALGVVRDTAGIDGHPRLPRRSHPGLRTTHNFTATGHHRSDALHPGAPRLPRVARGTVRQLDATHRLGLLDASALPIALDAVAMPRRRLPPRARGRTGHTRHHRRRP